MSVTYSFMDDSVYGADDINYAFSKLTTEGVSLFKYDKGNNPLTSLNDAVKGFIEPGVEIYNPDACKVNYDSENNKYTIGVGSAFMIDGSSVSIDTEPYDISDKVAEIRKSGNADIWVCFYRNIPMNRIEILAEDNYKNFNSQYSVPLAKISSNNTVVDMRTFAKTKMAPCSANVIQTGAIENVELIAGQSGNVRKRMVLKNIFPGATKVLMNGILHDIQRVDANGGEVLGYKMAMPRDDSSGEYVAFNYSNDGLEIWMYVSYNSTTILKWEMMIF